MQGKENNQKIKNMYMLNTIKSKEQNTYLSIFGEAYLFFDHLLCILCSFKPA